MPRLRQLLDAHSGLWRECGDLAQHAEDAWLRLVAGGNLMLRESLLRTLDELRAELTIDPASPLERLLVQRVVVSWLQASYADAAYAQLPGSGATLAQIKAAEQRQGRSQHRLVQSIKMLAVVRRLLRPARSPVDLAMQCVPETAPSSGKPSRRERNSHSVMN
jgi:hypothetical protein